MTIEEMIETSKGYDALKKDRLLSVERQLAFSEGGCMIISGSDNLLMTDLAREQAYSKLGTVALRGRNRPLPAKYLDACPDHLWMVNMNYWRDKTPGHWLVKQYGDKCRAVLSEGYVTTGVTKCLETVRNTLQASPTPIEAKLYNVWLTPDEFRASVAVSTLDVSEDMSKDYYRVGFDVGTGEVGNKAIWARPFVQRTSCTNSMVFENGFYSRHNHIRSEVHAMAEFSRAILTAIDATESHVARVLDAIHEPLADIGAVIQRMAKKHKWSAQLAYAVNRGTEGHGSLFGLVQGISYAANTVEQQEKKFELQVLAGKTLSNG